MFNKKTKGILPESTSKSSTSSSTCSHLKMRRHSLRINSKAQPSNISTGGNPSSSNFPNSLAKLRTFPSRRTAEIPFSAEASSARRADLSREASTPETARLSTTTERSRSLASPAKSTKWRRSERTAEEREGRLEGENLEEDRKWRGWWWREGFGGVEMEEEEEETTITNSLILGQPFFFLALMMMTRVFFMGFGKRHVVLVVWYTFFLIRFPKGI